ncbi:ASCH domain-containing protein [Pseudomonas viridiflava]|uniref:ASCH domain-containing protein n=1 Tax=Pseudomonas TaxID=286 RepID=UPI001F12FE5A
MSSTKQPRRLILPLKAEYFDAIRAGTKPEEYRLVNDYWRKRLEGREYDLIELTKGYPKRGDTERRLVLPWRGYKIVTITHPHFDNVPVQVFAIDVSEKGWPATWGSDDDKDVQSL